MTKKCTEMIIRLQIFLYLYIFHCFSAYQLIFSLSFLQNGTTPQYTFTFTIRYDRDQTIKKNNRFKVRDGQEKICEIYDGNVQIAPCNDGHQCNLETVRLHLSFET